MPLLRLNILAAMTLMRCVAAFRPLVLAGRPRASVPVRPSLSKRHFLLILKAHKEEELSMENLYTEWTLEDDQLLWEHRSDSTTQLAALLGRGLRGVEARLTKLNDVDSPAYERLFAGGIDETTTKKEKLAPVSEILRRIQWDYSLTASDFNILHYDRVEDEIMESPLDAPNASISGNSKLLIDALPEHRIVAVKYKERIVWDREKRLDRFFAGGIEQVMAEYEEWKEQKDAKEQWLRQRQSRVSTRMRQILGLERYAAFKDLSQDLQSLDEPSKRQVEVYVEKSLSLFQQVRTDPTESLDPSWIPQTDTEAVESLSELVALSPNSRLRQDVLRELARVLGTLEGGKPTQSVTAILNRQLPELPEDELEESFVRGSGAGGQKINKTSNKVVLVHKPTQLRVECQETRSLPQNRKIARKRLRVKLDEFLNGSQSKTSVKADQISTKKAKAKAKSRARHRKKAAAKEDNS